MTALSTKTIALTAVIALGSLLSSSAHAALVRSSDGAPVTTKDGGCVINNWEGADDCNANAGNGDAMAKSTETKVDREKIVYFDFNKSVLTPNAKHRLNHLAHKIRWMEKHEGLKAEDITIVGYADRLGTAKHNDVLAKKRAETVRSYLVHHGVKAKHIDVRSLGSSDSHSNCPANLPRRKLISCLREDRRVEVEFKAAK